LGDWELAFVVLGGFFFFEFFTPSTLGHHNFLNFIPFSMIFSATNVPIKGVQFLFGLQKQWNIPFESSLP
jgi:hypothetical protein